MRTKQTGWKEMGSKEMRSKETEGEETGGKEIGGEETGGEETGVKAMGAKAPGAQYRQETGRKGDMLMGERKMDNMLPGDMTAGQNVAEVIRRKSYSEVVIEGVRRARVFVGDSKVRKTDRTLNKGDNVVVCFLGAKIEAITKRVKKIVGPGKGSSILVHVGTSVQLKQLGNNGS